MTNGEEPAAEEPKAAAEANGLFILTDATDYSFTGTVLEVIDVSDRYDMLTVEDLDLPEKTRVMLIRDGKTYFASVDDKGLLAWEEDPFVSEGLDVLASRIAIDNGDVLLQIVFETNGERFLRELVFKPL